MEVSFLTDKSGRKLLAELHPHLLNIWDGFVENIKRSDMLRYLLLYEFGGVNANIDIESGSGCNEVCLRCSGRAVRTFGIIFWDAICDKQCDYYDVQG
ncbi:hypothetical protein DPMN_070199 [Dreissena polymorpha]|uniref:Uncharacterized protein n=1 Tax=Dreissena polymorpha TaxID=45954 RepID=A0A9D3Z2I9_DREPO|nr:hypothetical protein DPMN_070199 [Dreissena polymorpha]